MVLLIALSLFAAASDTLSLEQAYRHAIEAYPLRQQIALQETISELRFDNINVRRLPVLSVKGQAVYYSDVVKLELDGLPADISQPANDQYKVALGIDQLVYDGGVTRQLEALESVQRDLEQGKVEVELYRLKEQVNAAFFGALMFKSQAGVLDLLRADLESKLALMRSLVENGASLQSNADVLEAEMVNVEQQLIDVLSKREWALGVLSELVDRPIGSDDTLLMPDTAERHALSLDRDRPEFRVFDLGRTALAGQAELIRLRNRPSVKLFTEVAFGRPPGLDFFETGFKPFYSAGIRLDWNPWKWKMDRRERQILDLEAELLDAEERSFSKQISIALRKDRAEIERLRQLIARDGEVVRLRGRIAREVASQLEYGVATSSEYLTERNAEARAQLALKIHRIQLAQARAQYLTTIGK